MPACKCPNCGTEINAAALLASKPRGKRSPEAAEQSRQAARSRWSKNSKSAEDQPATGTKRQK